MARLHDNKHDKTYKVKVILSNVVANRIMIKTIYILLYIFNIISHSV